jgi:hypothetical protein
LGKYRLHRRAVCTPPSSLSPVKVISLIENHAEFACFHGAKEGLRITLIQAVDTYRPYENGLHWQRLHSASGSGGDLGNHHYRLLTGQPHN